MFTSLRNYEVAREEDVNQGVWRNSEDVCALADNERQLGHIVRTDAWHAYDTVHPNPHGTGFTYLGAFQLRNDAKLAVEAAAGRAASYRTRGATY